MPAIPEYDDNFARRYCPLCGDWTVTTRNYCPVDGCAFTFVQPGTTKEEAEQVIGEILFAREWKALEESLSARASRHLKETVRISLSREEVDRIVEMMQICMQRRCNTPDPLELWHWLRLRRAQDLERTFSRKTSEQRRLEFARWLYQQGRITDHPVLPRRGGR